ncbi:NADH:flavin oxidoreductase [Sphingopyxis witflariensis]|uniref:Flavin oxidoreductase n=1 Tax=Sphingopyxis witflariensis TaxID=173675 RepID=A0A246JU22_9SPHN|nr:NADH:flavin oxidoreductase [Sphingopyxis witflariensis]OWQ96528.1 flavin oxidoreductase [Sphingopyxis witflariensis]
MSGEAASPFFPLTLGPLTLRNRFIKAATNEGMAKNGVVSKGLALFHERVAEGGAAMSTVAYCATSRDGRTFVDQATLERESIVDFRALTDGVHRHGAAACAQITHAGSFTFLGPDQLQAKRPPSSSGGFNKVGMLSKRWFKKRMNRDEIAAMADEFVEAAKLAREAGFDAVELHMGHGYLLSQFISPVYNKRRDEFGGTIEKRMRFPAEVLSRVLDAVGKDLAVVVKYSMTDGTARGNQIADGVQVARILERTGAHMAVLSNGLNVESITAMFGSSFPKENRASNPNPIIRMGMWLQSLTEPQNVVFHENYLRDHALKIREAVTMPLAYLGGVHSIEGVEIAMADGFDCVAMGRILIHDPKIVNQWAAGTAHASGCTACNRCVSMMYLPTGTHCILTGAQDAALNKIAAGA